MILQTNLNDELYKGLTSHYKTEEIDSVINQALANYLEELSEQRDCEIALQRKNSPEKLVSMQDVFGA